MPNDPKLLFLQVAILTVNPDLDRDLHALTLLQKLVKQYPDRADYRLALLRLAGKIHARNENFKSQIAIALSEAD